MSSAFPASRPGHYTILHNGIGLNIHAYVDSGRPSLRC